MQRLMMGMLAAGALALTAPGSAAAGGGGADKQEKRDEAEIKLAALDPAFAERVAQAVVKGREFLLKRAPKDGHWTTKHDTTHGHGPFPHGATALVLLTLLKCDVYPGRDEITRGFNYLKESWDQFTKAGKQRGPKGWKVYEAGLTLMALQALDAFEVQPPKKGHSRPVGALLKKKGFDTWAGELRDFLVETQVGPREIRPGDGARGGMKNKKKKTRSTSSSAKPIKPKEAWSYPQADQSQADHSNTQYAVLGLRAAAQLGFPPPPEVWENILYHFLDLQEPEGPAVKRRVLDVKKLREKGKTRTRHRIRTEAHVTDHARGWGYPGNQLPNPAGGQLGTTGSMTTVGIACVAIAWHELQLMAKGDRARRWPRNPALWKKLNKTDLEDQTEESLWDGWAWLAHHWSVTENPQLGNWHYYYLYGLERAGVLTGTHTVGGHDWYREGGDLLLGAQSGGGSWDSGKGDGLIPSTCFALLFLKRATVPLVQKTK